MHFMRCCLRQIIISARVLSNWWFGELLALDAMHPSSAISDPPRKEEIWRLAYENKPLNFLHLYYESWNSKFNTKMFENHVKWRVKNLRSRPRQHQKYVQWCNNVHSIMKKVKLELLAECLSDTMRHNETVSMQRASRDAADASKLRAYVRMPY